MSVLFSPIFNSQVVDDAGDPASGWKIYAYAAGSSTPQDTYTTSAGTVAQSNPIVINSLGFPTTGQIWLTAGLTYKLVLTDENDVVQKTEDNISGVNDVSTTADQWVASGLTPTYISATSFSLVGDQTTAFHVGRRLKTTNSGGTVYSTIVTSAYGAVTTVTVVNDSGTLDAGLSAVSYGLLTATNPSTPLLADTYPIVSGSSDKTKKLRFEVDGLTTATTRVITMPDSDLTLPIINLNSTRAPNLVLAGPASGSDAVPAFRALVNADIALFSPTTNSISGDVALNNTSNFFDGPSISQGSTGTWFVSGTITVLDTAGAAVIYAKLWDGTTVVSSAVATIAAASGYVTIALSGYISSPAGNLRISARDVTSTSGSIRANSSGASKDSTITAIRIA